MPHSLSPALAALALALLAVVAAMFAALLGGLLLLIRGDRVLPEMPPLARTVPWSWRTVVATVVFYFIVLNLTVFYGYSLVAKSFGGRIGGLTTAAKTISKKQPVAAGNLADQNKVHAPIPVVAIPPTPPVLATKNAAETRKEMNFTEMMALVSVVNVLFILCLPLILRPSTTHPISDLGWTTGHWVRDVGLGLGAFLVITPVVMIVQLLATKVWAPNSHPLQGMLREGLSPGAIALAYLSAVVLAPIAEELLFRGVLQGWLVKLGATKPTRTSEFGPFEIDPPGAEVFEESEAPSHSPKWRLLPNLPAIPGFGPTTGSGRSWRPIGVTSFFFGLVHFQQMPAPIAIFFLALALGWLREATGSLVPSIVLHAAFNGFNTTLMVLAVSVIGPQPAERKPADIPPAAAVENRVAKSTFRLALDRSADRFGRGVRRSSGPSEPQS